MVFHVVEKNHMHHIVSARVNGTASLEKPNSKTITLPGAHFIYQYHLGN